MVFDDDNLHVSHINYSQDILNKISIKNYMWSHQDLFPLVSQAAEIQYCTP